MSFASREDIAQNLGKVFEEIQAIFPGHGYGKKELRQWFRHYRHLLDLCRNFDGKVLEIGTGFGVLAAGLAGQLEKTVFTIEHPSRDFFSCKEYINYLAGKGIHLVGCDLSEGIPFRNKSFDLICCSDVIEHLQPKQITLLSHEIYRLLRPTGRLLLSTPNLGRIHNIWRILKGEPVNPRLAVERHGETYGHVREFMTKELTEIFSGLTVEKIAYRPLLPVDDFFFSWKGPILSAIARCYPRWCEEIYMLLRKT